MFSGLGNVVTCSDNIPSYYCISRHWHKSLELCKLSFVDGQFYNIWPLHLPCRLWPDCTKFPLNLFVVCSWNQVMKRSACSLGDSCVSGTGVHMRPTGCLQKPVRKVLNKSKESNEQEMIGYCYPSSQCTRRCCREIKLLHYEYSQTEHTDDWSND